MHLRRWLTGGLSYRREVYSQVTYPIPHGNYSPIAISKMVLSTVNRRPLARVRTSWELVGGSRSQRTSSATSHVYLMLLC